MNKKQKIENIIQYQPLKTKEGKYFYVDNDNVEESVIDSLDKIKTWFKKIRPIYYALIYIVSPVYPSMIFRLRKFLRNQPEQSIILNLGSGNSYYNSQIINVDLLPYEEVDVVSDLKKLPFKDNSVDAIVNIAVLEHVPNPEVAVAEMYRVLKKEGQLLSFIPFMQGFHASPYDFQRYTEEGIKVLFQDFTIQKQWAEGPTSGFLWITQEWLAIVLSLGIKPLHQVLYILIMLLTFPIKFLDIILVHFPTAKNISTGFTVLAKK